MLCIHFDIEKCLQSVLINYTDNLWSIYYETRYSLSNESILIPLKREINFLEHNITFYP